MPQKPLIIEQFVYSLFYPAILGSFLFYLFDWNSLLAQPPIFLVLLLAVIALFCLDYFHSVLTMHLREGLDSRPRAMIATLDFFTVVFFRLSFEAIDDISNFGPSENSTNLVNLALIVCSICTVTTDLTLKKVTIKKLIQSFKTFIIPILQLSMTGGYLLITLINNEVPIALLDQLQVNPKNLANKFSNSLEYINTPIFWFAALVLAYFVFYTITITTAFRSRANYLKGEQP